jgi:hypothetical protein
MLRIRSYFTKIGSGIWWEKGMVTLPAILEASKNKISITYPNCMHNI